MKMDMRRKAATWAILLGCGFALMRCGHEQVAGSSVTTGNPTEIQVSFTGGNGPEAIAGRVEIYAATQVPVPGYRPEPLARHDVNGSTFTLTASHFEGIADSLWAEGSRQGDSLRSFNLVITGANQGAIMEDLIFHLGQGGFSRASGGWKNQQGVKASLEAGLSGLTAFTATMDTVGLSGRRVHFLFLYGTGFHARNNGGVFEFPAMPAGPHKPYLISIPTREFQSTSPTDSLNVYNLDKVIEAGTTSLARQSVADRIPVPTELP